MSSRAEHLPETGHAGLEVEAPARPAVDVMVLLGDERARTDQAHLATEHVEQLRELVQRSAAQEASDAGDARVVLDLEHPLVAASVLVQVRDLVLAPLGVGDHRAELEDLELAVIAADPRLAEEHRAGRVELDRERCQCEEREPARSSPTTEPAMSIVRLSASAARRAVPEAARSESAPRRHGSSSRVRSPRTGAGRCRPGHRAR